MKTKAIAIFSLLLMVATVFAATACDTGGSGDKAAAAEDWYSQEEYRKAGDCYNEAEVWDKCVLSYLKAGRISEMKWYSDTDHSDISFRSEAMLMYNSEYYDFSGLGSDMGVCMYNTGDTQLDDDMDDYHEWITFFAARAGDPPWDMQAKIDAMETKLFPVEALEPEAEEPEIAPATTSTTPVPETIAEEPEAQGFDMTMILILGIIAVVVIAGAAFFFMKKK